MLQSLTTPGFLTIGQAAELLGVSTWTLRNWDKSGKLKTLRHPKSGYRIYRHEDLRSLLESSGRQANADLAPQVDWSEMGECEHFVQFYERDEFLMDSVSGFVAGKLAHRTDLACGIALALVIALGATASIIARPGAGAFWTQTAALLLFAPASLAGDWVRKRTGHTS